MIISRISENKITALDYRTVIFNGENEVLNFSQQNKCRQSGFYI
jgi:hypothetical protein